MFKILSKISHRTITGLTLAIISSLCLYANYTNILFVAITAAVVYDAIFLLRSMVNKKIVIVLLVAMVSFNIYLLRIYNQQPYDILKIVFITQVSDIYQYIIGSRLGKNKIGWISKNKTYEGYVGGYILTMATFVPILYFMDVNPFFITTIVYFLGIVSGLLSSIIKRYIGIKDYSDLLGAHGGWIDRIDSIVLPSLLYYFY